MRLAMSELQLRDLLIRQLSSLYFLNEAEAETLEGVLPKGLERCEVCFSHVRNKYYSDNGGCTNLVSQGCTVGNNHGEYPSFGESVFMLSNSKVLGGCEIGSHVIISANTYIKDTDIPSGSIVFGQSPNLVIKTGREDYVREYAEGIFRYE